MKNRIVKFSLVLILGLAISGCTFVIQRGRRSDIDKIEDLSRQLDELQATKRLLEERLGKEINDQQVRLKMAERGLVITFLADIVFDSGKASIRREAYPVLDKVARILKENVPDLQIGIEGYTDNQPIKISNWKSNWQLSTERALSVLHYLVDKKGIDPRRLSAIGHGENYPVAPNNSPANRRLNRRVEIVIMPRLTKVSEASPVKGIGLKEIPENFK